MPVGSIFTQTDIGDDEEGRKFGSEETDRLDDRSLGVVSCRAKSIFGVGCGGYTEEDDGAKTFADERGEMGNEFAQATAALIGKRGDEGFFIWAVRNE